MGDVLVWLNRCSYTHKTFISVPHSDVAFSTMTWRRRQQRWSSCLIWIIIFFHISESQFSARSHADWKSAENSHSRFAWLFVWFVWYATKWLYGVRVMRFDNIAIHNFCLSFFAFFVFWLQFWFRDAPNRPITQIVRCVNWFVAGDYNASLTQIRNCISTASSFSCVSPSSSVDLMSRWRRQQRQCINDKCRSESFTMKID